MKFKKILFIILCAGLQNLHSSQGYNPSLAQLTDLAHLAVTAPLNAWRMSIDVNSQNINGTTALMRAAYRSFDSEVERLLRVGADPNLADNHGITALMMAANVTDNAAAVEMLLRAGADPNLVDNVGSTALIWAVRSGNANAVAMLLRVGVDPNLADNYGSTALIWAVRSGNVNVVEMLLRAGADPNLKDNNGNTAIDIARIYGYSEDMFRINYVRPGGIKLPAVPPKAIEK